MGVENAELIEKEIPNLETEYDIIIKVYSAGLNPVDWKMCDWASPRGFGLDGCGLVFKAGEKVNKEELIVGETIVYFHGNLFRT